VGSVKELGEKFANHCGASYVESFEGVKKVIKNADENSIVIVYSAGDIDYDLRKWLH
jgi:UDP-N-acetylmuramate-alanine ligase